MMRDRIFDGKVRMEAYFRTRDMLFCLYDLGIIAKITMLKVLNRMAEQV